MKTEQLLERSKASVMKRMSLIAILTVASLMPAMAARAHRAERGEGENTEVRRPDKSKAMKCEKGLKHKPDAETIALHKAKKCREVLRLTDEQYNKVFLIYKKAFSDLDKMRQKEGGADVNQGKDFAKEEKSKARKEFHAGIDKQMSKVLSEAQYAEWKQMNEHSRRTHHKKQHS